MAQQLRDVINIWENVPERVGVITDLEHQGDAITHLVTRELHRTFVTPFDREDVTLLAQSLDDVADFIHSAADAMLLYKVDRPSNRAKELADIIVQAVTEVETAIFELRPRVDQKQILKRCTEINRLENVADKVYQSASVELFAESTDIAHIIKWREIYEHMESATDRCEDVANVLEGVALKYA